jgi:hypothetical protein
MIEDRLVCQMRTMVRLLAVRVTEQPSEDMGWLIHACGSTHTIPFHASFERQTASGCAVDNSL